MPIIEKVAWDFAGDEDIAYRFPNLSLKYGSQVIVKENQWAVFFRDGKAYDVFGPGRHTITSNNIPLLTGALKALRIIGDVFSCEVVYVSNSQFRGKFGGQAYSAPSGAIQYQAELGYYGYLLYKIEDPKLFVIEFFGNKGASTSTDIENYIRGFINERVIDEFANHDIFNVVKNVDETTDKVSLIIKDEAARIGLKIIDTVFEGVKIPEEARRFATTMGQQAMTMQYMKETTAELPEGGGAAGAGVGAGIGIALGNTLGKAMQPSQSSGGAQQVLLCPNCGSQNNVGAKFCGNCGKSLAPVAKIICPKCGAAMPESMKFCGNCGSPMKPKKINCPKCNTENLSTNKFCGNCGNKLE
ncbi:MAG: SPFH domain-containing protein [Candidatus Bathyarchaeota archaeon]|nr:MAG: SPFH domain-containing protein [Candidatus Bathyarchaeota archaeon]